MLTSAERREFDRLGIVRLRSVLPSPEVERMRERLWSALSHQHGMLPHVPETWTIPRPSGFQALVRSGAFASMASGPVCRALDDLLRPGGWLRPERWGQPLVTSPSGGRWEVPHKHWHFDILPDAPISELHGVVIFAYLDAVDPRGGGTVAVTGSHRLVSLLAPSIGATAPTRSAEIREALLHAEPWIAALRSRNMDVDRVHTFMEEHVRSDGIMLRVVELTGEPGDVVLMDVRLLHAPAPNCRSVPRLTLAQRIYRAERGSKLGPPTERERPARAALTVSAVAVSCFLVGIAHLYLTVPFYSTVKATYGLSMVPALGLLAANGLEWLLDRRWGRVLSGYLSSWVLCDHAAFFVR